MHGMCWHASSPCSLQMCFHRKSYSKSISGLWLRSQHIPPSWTRGSCLVYAHQVFPLIFFDMFPTLKLCTQTSPHTCPTQPCVQDNFSCFVFRKQTGSIPSHAEFLPALSPSLSNSTLSCSRESSSSFRSGVLLCFIHQHILQNYMVDVQI